LIFFYETVLQLLKQPFSQSVLTSQTTLTKHALKTYTITNYTSAPITYDCEDCKEVGLWWDKPTVKTPQGFVIPPGEQLIVAQRIPDINLVFLSPAEGFFVILKITFWTAVLFSAPFWGYFLYQFISPALAAQKKYPLLAFAIVIFLCVLAGIVAAIYMLIPAANQYLLWFNASLGENFWSFERYIDYTLMLILACCIAFELGACLFFAVHLEIISPTTLRHYRRHAIVAAFVIAAVLTPPDVFTQFLIALPLCFLYEGSILYGRMLRKA
ncbi:MAG: twin-arginine translocase subunit TatC, partial [Parachlamydiales bacterium]